MVLQDDPITTFSSQVKRTVGVSAFAVRFNDSGTYTYVGTARPGTATSAASWQIKRIKNSDNGIDWADGDAQFNNVWNNVTSLSYS